MVPGILLEYVRCIASMLLYFEIQGMSRILEGNFLTLRLWQCCICHLCGDGIRCWRQHYIRFSVEHGNEEEGGGYGVVNGYVQRGIS